MQYRRREHSPLAHAMGVPFRQIVNEIIAMKDDLSPAELQSAMDCFIESQVLIPGEWKPIEPDELEGSSAKSRLLKSMLTNLEECKETV